MNTQALIEFVTPYYSAKDTMHDLTHTTRILQSLSSLINDGKYEADTDILTYATYFHGIIYKHEQTIANWLQDQGLKPETCAQILSVAWDSQKDHVPHTLEGKLLHDAHLIEGGTPFLMVKSLVTGSARGQSLEETLTYMKQHIVDQGTCYLPEAISIYEKQQAYLKQFLRELNPIEVREMTHEDAVALMEGFALEGWHKPLQLFEQYLSEANLGQRDVLVGVFNGVVVGYVTLVPKTTTGPFANKNIPEIVDFNVLPPFQSNGVGTALMNAIESIASTYNDVVSLAVGLHAGYGSAQRMYVKRGYLPDGSGVWYGQDVATPYAPMVNDDDLVLYFSKSLSILL